MEAARAIERKVVTALFCDVVGSTELGERLDPEDIDRLLGTYHRLARERIEANGGTVEKFIGDAVVGVFGAPVVHEDDPARAIRAALGIIHDLEASGLTLQVRIGVQTGEAVVRVGEDRTAEEGLATGDILNTAARLQNAASPGGIAVGDATYRLAAAEFEWEDLGAIPLKGKALPVQTWRPIRARHDAAPAGPEATAFVGREAELGALLAAFERSVGGPAVELVTIVAEPGMGKSRLVRELGGRVLATPGVSWHRGRSLPYGEGVSFWALGEIVKTHAGILDTDDDATIRTKLDAAISAPDAKAHDWMRERLAPLVGIGTDAAPPTEEEQLSAWSQFLVSLAVDGPAVLVFEDLHWADPALVTFLLHLADLPDAVPLLVLVTARPEVAERHPDWLPRARRSTLVQLVSLDDRAIRTLIEQTFAGAPESLIETVLERAGGSPLYAEQLAALARERGLSAADATLDATMIPPTIQALLAARIDALPGDLKPALLDASVIGRIFWSGAVATLEGAERQAVAETLEQLARRELTREHASSTMVGEAEYGFWHALLRDVAYSFLPRAARLAKHRAAAAWITDRSAGTLGDLAEIVADHLRRALELATATGAQEELPQIRSDLADALIAAAAHTRAIEPARAIEQIRAALELLGTDDRRRPPALTALARALHARGQFLDAAGAYEAAAAAHRHLGDELAAAELAVPHAAALSMGGEESRGQAIIEVARPVLETHGGQGLVDLYVDDALRETRGNDNGRALESVDAALSLAESLGLPRPYRALAQRGVSRLELGDVKGEADVRDAVELATAAGDNRFAMGALGNLASQLQHAADSLATFGEAIVFGARYGLTDGHVRALRLDTLEVAGRWDEAVEEAVAMRELASSRGDAYTAFMTRMVQGGIEANRGTVTAPIEDLMEEAEKIGFRRYVPAGAMALSALARGDAAGVRRTVADALEHLPAGEFLAGAVSLVEASLGIGDIPLARRVLANTLPGTMDGGPANLSDLATGLVLEAEGDAAGALARFEWSDAFYEQHGWLGAHAIALAGIGRCRLALGDAAAGIEGLAGAREIAATLKAQPLLRAIDAALGSAPAADELRA